MSFVVSARKYRPQTFSEVVGQEHVTSTLERIIQKDKLAHAYLFTGPRGVGKTTCARIFAKVINSDPDTADQVSGKDEPNYAADSSMNVFELDAASNNSVDHIRNLTEQVRIRPQKGKYRVFIIDEVHMLSTQAFNAFLKTLEEPPSYAIFILATTEKHKIIPTILSRCQIYDFHRISIPKIIEQLRHVAAQEQIGAEDDALYLIAEKADGALRDALSLFDRLASASDGTITYSQTVENLFVLDHSYYFAIADAVLREDSSEIFRQVDDVLRKGFQGDQLINGLSQHYRNLLLTKDAATADILDISPELRKRYEQQAKLFRSDHLMTAIDISNQCDIHYQRAQNKRLHVEIALLKQCYIGRDVTPSVAPVIPQKKNSVAQPSKESEKLKKPTIQATPSPADLPSHDPKQEEPVENDVKPVSETAVPAATESTSRSKSLNLDHLIANIKKDNEQQQKVHTLPKLEKIKELWEKLAQAHESPSVTQVMRKAILATEDMTLIVNVPNKVGKELIQQEKTLLQELRSDLGIAHMEISVVVNRELFPDVETPQMPVNLSDAERYEILKQQNPLLSSFVKSLDLKPISR